MSLNNEKITLRNFEEKDFSEYKKWNTGKHLWMDFDAPYYAKMTNEEVLKRIQFHKNNIDTSTSLNRQTVIADKTTNEIVGMVSWYWQSEETLWLSIGIVIFNEKYWNKGIGFEALKKWTGYLFTSKKDIVRIDLRTWSGNYGMIKVAKNLGFKLEANFRNARIVNGKYYDSLGFGILRSEWDFIER